MNQNARLLGIQRFIQIGFRSNDQRCRTISSTALSRPRLRTRRGSPDFTYIWTAEGCLNVASAVDLFSDASSTGR